MIVSYKKNITILLKKNGIILKWLHLIFIFSIKAAINQN